jgi:hypothetical protein
MGVTHKNLKAIVKRSGVTTKSDGMWYMQLYGVKYS